MAKYNTTRPDLAESPEPLTGKKEKEKAKGQSGKEKEVKKGEGNAN